MRITSYSQFTGTLIPNYRTDHQQAGLRVNVRLREEIINER
jgi:hypothetical protein